MSTLTKQTLAFAIFSISFEICRLADRIDTVSPEVEEEEHLCDTLMNMERSLGELSGHYLAYKSQLNQGDDFETLCANAEEAYKQFCAKQNEPSVT